MDPISQLPLQSPHSTRAKSSTTLLSPSKPHASPSKARRQSPRKSPVKHRNFQAVPATTVSFAPERTKQPPRAWERRPATPFIPRDDKQRIWKRVPLGELGLDSHKSVNMSRREREAGKDYVRVVKKLKVGHDHDDEDKENMSFHAKVDIENGDLKRSVKLNPHFVTMKMEEEVIAGSPKKKLRAARLEPDMPAEQDLPNEHVEAFEDQGHDDVCEPAIQSQSSLEVSSAQAVVCEDGSPSEFTDAITIEIETKDQKGDASNLATMEGTPDTSVIQNVAGSETSQAKKADPYLANVSCHSVDVDSDTVTDATGLQTETSLRPTLSTESENHQKSIVNERHDLPAQTLKQTGSVVAMVQPNTDMEKDGVESPTMMPEEPRSSSPPTILAENVVVDELESRDATKAEVTIGEESVLQEELKIDDTKAQDVPTRRVSDDETAFLRNFVSSTKAERAAREKLLQDMLLNDPADQPREDLEPTGNVSGSISKVAQEAEEQPVLDIPTAQVDGTMLSSPLRRSKRAVTTNIPRPQALPNAIQLKRANGNEFIFTANKASSGANVAVITRSNTKRNKGSALSVQERLEQLVTGEWNGETDAKLVDCLELLSEQSANPTSDNVGEKHESKKRKRDGKDGTARVKKVLKWNDEKLVSYQEAETRTRELEDIEDSSQDAEDVGFSEGGSEKHVKLTLTFTSSDLGTSGAPTATSEITAAINSSKEESKDNSNDSSLAPSQSKVRRVRRGTSGSVNGTPGPKTRSRQILNLEDGNVAPAFGARSDNDDAIDTEESVATGTHTQALNGETSKSSLSKKSRMPMPVLSGARRGAAASASMRTATSAGPSTTGPASRNAKSMTESQQLKRGTAPKVKEANKPQAPKEEVQGDILGKRRLRVRP